MASDFHGNYSINHLFCGKFLKASIRNSGFLRLPDGLYDGVGHTDALDEHCANADADHDEETLKAQDEEPGQKWYEGNADERYSAARHKLFHAQLVGRGP